MHTKMSVYQSSDALPEVSRDLSSVAKAFSQCDQHSSGLQPQTSIQTNCIFKKNEFLDLNLLPPVTTVLKRDTSKSPAIILNPITLSLPPFYGL